MHHPLDEWKNGADNEEENGNIVELAMGEQPLWSDDTPLWHSIMQLQQIARMNDNLQ